MPIPADHYRGYDDLSGRYVEGVDYSIHVVHPPRAAAAAVAVIAPHGGGIEGGTSEIARQIAATDHGLYLFEGLRTTGDNFECLPPNQPLFR